MAYLDMPDTLIATLTDEGRNLLGRAKLGDVVYKQLGWQLGRNGYLTENPVKVTPIVDDATQAEGLITVALNGSSNADWSDETYVSLNGKRFIFNTHFARGANAIETSRNIRNAIFDSKDLRHFRIVAPIQADDSIIIQSLITGKIGNSYPIYVNSPYNNIELLPMTGGISASLEDPSYPVPNSDPALPPILAPFSGTDGLIEMPSTDALSFLARVGENDGIGAYGEIGIWVEVKQSLLPQEVGRNVLFAVSHFPIQPKTDRSVLTFRVIIAF